MKNMVCVGVASEVVEISGRGVMGQGWLCGVWG